MRENGLKQGTFPFYVISADYHLSGITTWPEFWSKLPKNIQKPQQMTFMIIMFIRLDRTYRYSICTRLWKTGVGKKITILVNFKLYSIKITIFRKYLRQVRGIKYLKQMSTYHLFLRLVKWSRLNDSSSQTSSILSTYLS